MAISPTRFLKLRSLLGLSQKEMATKLGVTDKYVGMIERSQKPVEEDSPLGLLFQMLEQAASSPPKPTAGSRSQPKTSEDEPSATYGSKRRRERLIPVTSWAHAGEATSYEELPKHWQDQIPTECQDEHAFAVRLEGPSMEPKFSEGDLLILQPGKEPYSGCLAVCRFKNDGVVFRRVEFQPDAIRLIALNPAYPTDTYPRESFAWIYPVWGRWTQIWK
jgi:SOS-response transcriptional repressor LexA